MIDVELRKKVVLLSDNIPVLFKNNTSEMVPLQFIIQQSADFTNEQLAMLALQGGCRWLHLCATGLSDEELRPVAQRILAECRMVDATFVIEDRVDVVKDIKADGVFLGPNSMPANEARNILGHEFIIGGAVATYDDIVRLHRGSADYVCCGPYYGNKAMEDVPQDFCIEYYRAIADQMRAEVVRMPLVAVGGVALADIPDLLDAGVSGIAVGASELNRENVQETIRCYLAADE